MDVKVGIPRGMLFYDYYPLWNEFFQELGAEVVLSPKTNKEIMDLGLLSAVDEACLPVKAYHGHAEYLRDKVDYLFIPKIMSVERLEYCCPKFLGLPEMVTNSVSDLPPIIDTPLNLRKRRGNLKKTIIHTGRYFTSNPMKIKKAFNNAFNLYQRYKLLLQSGVIPIEAIEVYNKTFKGFNKTSKENKTKIMIVGHPYNIYDEHLNMDLISKLKERNIEVITPEMIEKDKIIYYSNELPKRMFWSYGRRIVGSAFSVLEKNKVDGMIYVSSFGCGMDSILIDLVQRKAYERKIPFMLLVLDEHSGEAGINTRIEAFIDMLDWRNNDEGNISTHG